jgi:hypothetical protein
MYKMMAGDPAGAQMLFEESLACFRSLGHPMGVVDSLLKLGFAVQQQGHHAKANSSFAEGLELGHQLGYKVSIAVGLIGMAVVAVNQGALERAARLGGAAEALLEVTRGLDPDGQLLYDRAIRALHSQLDQATLTARWAEGRALGWQQAIAYALEAAG